MMKKMTNEEIQAFYNGLESRRLEIKQDMANNPPKYRGMAADVKEWIRGKRNFAEISDEEKLETVMLLLDSEDTKRSEVVLEALKATEDPKLIEIANKYETLKRTSAKTLEQAEIAKAILSVTYVGQEKAPSADDVYSREKGKVTTIGKELQQIKQRHKKLANNEAKAMRKYRHISQIDIDDLYYMLRDFCSQRISSRQELDSMFSDELSSDRTLPKIRAFVLDSKNQDDVTEAFYETPSLKFAQSQKKGHLK